MFFLKFVEDSKKVNVDLEQKNKQIFDTQLNSIKKVPFVRNFFTYN
ncbi:hypothetical protein BWR56_1284 [Streptococcus oralis]|nr:hypothetical protein BWR56_1284 [Streptococcus oralis]